MTNRRASLLLDLCMFGSFAVLMSWRLTGVAAHEWLGSALIAMLVVHLLVHWGWVESRVAGAARATGGRRRLVPLLLNTGLFVAMGTALVSGVVVSKVVLPNRLTPEDYLRWHGVHETASTVAVIMLGLHVALNWDRILAGLRRSSSGARSWVVRPGTLLRRLASITVVSAVLVAGVWKSGRLLPVSNEVLMVFPDGHQERRAPPPEIARLSPEANRPVPARGAARVLMSLVLLTVAAVVGRRVLKLRLAGPRGGPVPPAYVSSSARSSRPA